MAKLYFRYGAMNSGKSTALLQVAHNYVERDQRVLIAKPTIDTKSLQVVSRLGANADVNYHVLPNSNVLEDIQQIVESESTPIDCILIDEAQFLTPEQVDGFLYVATFYNIPVIAYGLRTDFIGQPFPGAIRLLAIAHSLEELKTICRCGRKAIFNARSVNGQYVHSGEQVAIDNSDMIEYEAMCASCYFDNVGRL